MLDQLESDDAVERAPDDIDKPFIIDGGDHDPSGGDRRSRLRDPFARRVDAGHLMATPRSKQPAT
jgi:hypothetical protein